MIIEKVYSPIENKVKEVDKASFWKECYHENEITKELLNNGKHWYIYHVKFDGLRPIMITKKETINF